MTHYRSRILIVEDEEILAQNLRDFLSRRAAEVCTAASAEAAFDEVRRFRPDYAVLDYSLPGASGLEAFSRLKVDFPHLRGALISGHPTEQLLGVATKAGIEHVLTKPFSFAEFERVLSAWHSEGAAGPGDGIRHSDEGRRVERRSNRPAPQFPLGTPGGWVLQDRRLGDRRVPAIGSPVEFSAGLVPS
jgi:DNA-binding response OmpR family regulator